MHFPKGPFAISFEFLFTVWQLSAISAIFAKYAIFAIIATFQRAPLPSHLNFCLLYSLAINCHFCHFRQIRHFRQTRHLAKGPFAISFEFLFIVWRFWRLIAISAIFANACISGHISTWPLSADGLLHLGCCLCLQAQMLFLLRIVFILSLTMWEPGRAYPSGTTSVDILPACKKSITKSMTKR